VLLLLLLLLCTWEMAAGVVLILASKCFNQSINQSRGNAAAHLAAKTMTTGFT